MNEPSETFQLANGGNPPHDVPTMAQIVEAVREWIETSRGSGADAGGAAQDRYHARVAANMLAMVERELLLGAEHADRHAARLLALGVGDDAELCDGIANGDFDDSHAELIDTLRDSVLDKLAVANPGYARESGKSRPL